MSKYCRKCGLHMQEDDFLCPGCGMVWGDRIYGSAPAAPAPAVPAEMKPEPEEEAVQESVPENSAQEETAANEIGRKKLPYWLLPAAVGFMLALLLVTVGSALGMWAGERGTVPGTTGTVEPTTTAAPTLPEGEQITYTLKVVDTNGSPIPGVRITNPYYEASYYMDSFPGLSVTSPVLIPISALCTDSDGMLTFTLDRSLLAYVKITSVPEGYAEDLVGVQKFFAAGHTEMLIVLDYSDTPPLEIDPLYSATMENKEWLYEPLEYSYAPGKAYTIRITHVKNTGVMLFMGDQEVDQYQLVEGKYWEFVFEMPEEDVVFSLRTFDTSEMDASCELFVREFFRRYLNVKSIQQVDYYGEYNGIPVAAIDPGDNVGGVMISVVAGYKFYYYNEVRIQAYVEGTFYDLKQAYEYGFLTALDIGHIYNIFLGEETQ